MTPADQRSAVCVFCSSSDRIDEGYIALAAQVGTRLAQRGWTLVSGGGSVSCMGAVARAARAAGGRTIGVTPRALVDLEIADTESDELVITDDMRERKGEMDRRSDAFLALPGGIGTLEELLEVWVARTLGMHTKPVVVLDPDGIYRPLREQIDRLVSAGFMRADARAELRWASTIDEAIAQVEAGWAAGRPRVTAASVAEDMLEAEL